MREDDKRLLDVAKIYGTPLYVYSLDNLKQRAKTLLELNFPFGYIPRFAAKANINPKIIKLFDVLGLSFDASSSYEAMELVNLEVNPKKISLSSQQPPHNMDELLGLGIQFIATSMRQLEVFTNSKSRPSEVGLRVNPGYGSGGINRTNTGGINSSFGLWHDYLKDALSLAKRSNVRITRLHIHIGSGADLGIWTKVIDTALDILYQLPEITSLNIGGGFKVTRSVDEKEANMIAISELFSNKLIEFADKTGRKISLEIEPGTWLVAHSGTLISEIVDIIDTGDSGHNFIKLNTGMNDFIRPAMYGAQHKIRVLNDSKNQERYVVVGHSCETGDILTPANGNPEKLSERMLNKAKPGDIVAIYDTGAYGRYFAVSGYNSFPSAKEVCI